MAKKKVKKSALHNEVHDMWGWVVLVAAMLTIAGLAGWYYLNMF